MDNNIRYKLTADKYELNNIPQRQTGIFSPSDIFISIIIPTKERIDGLKAVLDSLPAAMDGINYEVIICQNQEDTQIAALLKNYSNIKQVIYDRDVFRSGESFFWSKLINYGFNQAKGNWLIFGSDDIVFYPKNFSNAVKKIDNDKIGAVSFLHKNTVETYGGFFDNYGFDTLNGDQVYLNFGIIKKEVFELTQRFDERYKFYWADVDICMQILELGYEITFSEDSLVDHVNILDSVKTGNSNTVFKDDTEYFSQKWRNSALFNNKNPLQKIRYFLNDRKVTAVKSQLTYNSHKTALSGAKFLIDGVIFDLQRGKFGGISYVWINYLERIATSDLRSKVVLLDRNNSAPDFPGIKKIAGRVYSDATSESRWSDAVYIDEICQREGITHFISTYYTYSLNYYNILMLHDFIPEALGRDLSKEAWPAKREAISKANYFICISENTKRDLARFYPQKYADQNVCVVKNGVSDLFKVFSAEDKADFVRKYQLKVPYFLICGYRSAHKNIASFLKAANLLYNPADFEIIFTGGNTELEKRYLPLLQDLKYRRIHFSAEEMPLVYNCAEALVFLSDYEGFGLPILEAMKCGCPVITCSNSSIPEVAGEAALYVDGKDIFAIKKALSAVGKAEIRNELIRNGLKQAAGFSWDKSYLELQSFLNKIQETINKPQFVEKKLNNKNTNTLDSNNSKILDFEQFLSLKFVHDDHVFHQEGSKCIYQDLIKRGCNVREIIFTIVNDPEYLQSSKYNISDKLKYDHMNHYINCIRYGFRESVEGWRDIESKYLIEESYYQNRRALSDAEIETMLQQNPISVYQQRICDGIHRAMCMIGRILAGKPYIPFKYVGDLVKTSPHLSVPNIGYREEHNLSRLKCILPLITKSCFKAVDIGSNFGFFSLNLANEFPNSQIFSIEGSYGTGNKEFKGIVEQSNVKKELNLYNNHIYNVLLSNEIIEEFNHQNFVFDYQLSFSVFHWIVHLKYGNSGSAADIEKMLIAHLKMAKITFIELPAITQITSMTPLYNNFNSLEQLFYSLNSKIALKVKKIGESKWLGIRELFCIELLNNESTDFSVDDIEVFFDKNCNKKSVKIDLTTNLIIEPLTTKQDILVSAIVSVYNSAKYLKGCLEDLIGQTLYKQNRLEIVIVNTGSQENDDEIVKVFQEKHRNIQYIKVEHRESLYQAWNRGIKAANGKYITNANTDDRHRDDALEIMAKILENNSTIDLVYSDCYVSNIANETFEENNKKSVYRYLDHFAPNALLFYQYGINPMWNKGVHQKIGYFDENYEIIGDYEFNLRFAQHFRAYHINEVLGLYYLNPDSLSFKKDKAKEEHIRLYKQYRDFKTIYKLYSMEQITSSTDQEKSEVLADMAVRALAFYPPWDLGKAQADLTFSQKCLEEALLKNPSLVNENKRIKELLKINQQVADKKTIGSVTNHSISDNYTKWSKYNWSNEGNEWSGAWGGADKQWQNTIFPRTKNFINYDSILEIAPGFGRCTQFMLPKCKKYIGVDLTDKCVEACKNKFKEYQNAFFYKNDGRSLEAIEDDSVSFVFSWDSFVHIEADVVRDYLLQLAAKMKNGAYGFIHHSNIARYLDSDGKLTVDNKHWRAGNMSAELFRQFCRDAGLQCVVQEEIAWGGDILNDCFSLFRKGEHSGEKTLVEQNYQFMEEALNSGFIQYLSNYQPVQTKSVSAGNKILLLCDYFWPSVGGVEVLVEDLGVQLLKQGYLVEVGCRAMPERTEFEHCGLKIIQFSCEGDLYNGFKGDITGYQDFLAKSDYQAIIVLAQPDNWVSVPLAQAKSRIKSRTIFLPSINWSDRERWYRRKVEEGIKQVISAFDRVISVTEDGQDALYFRQHKIDATYIPHSIEIDPEKLDIREHFGLSKQKPLLVMVANFWPVKNHLALVEEFKKSTQDWQLLIIGNPVAVYPDYYQSVKASADTDKRITIIPGLSRQMSAAAIAQADLLLVPSKAESAGPLVVLQAMNYGVPWIATPSCNGVHNEAGGIIADIDRFMSVAALLIRKPEVRLELGRQGKQNYSDNFSWQKTLSAYLNLIENRSVNSELFKLSETAMLEKNKLQHAVLELSMIKRPAKKSLAEIREMFPKILIAGNKFGMGEVNGVKGFLEDLEMQYLYNLALDLRKGGRILEIGSFMGLSAHIMAKALLEAGNYTARIHCVDWWTHFKDRINPEYRSFYSAENFMGNLIRLGLNQFIVQVDNPSPQSADFYSNNSLDIVFVDGDHSFAGCYKDLVGWYPKVKEGGVLIGHDYTWTPSVQDAVHKFTQENNLQFIKPPQGTSIFCIKKVD